jgi:predicted peroxiredoxin
MPAIKKTDKKLAMVISDPGLEMLLSPLGLALSAVLSGQDVYLFFQGPSVRVLKKGFKAKSTAPQAPQKSVIKQQLKKAFHYHG